MHGASGRRGTERAGASGFFLGACFPKTAEGCSIRTIKTFVLTIVFIIVLSVVFAATGLYNVASKKCSARPAS